MVSSYTTNKNLEKPGNGDYVDTWNVPVNSDMDVIDAAFGGVTNLNATGGSAVLTDTQYQKMALNITGAISAAVVYTIPSGVGGIWVVRNATTDATGGPWSITIASGGGGSSVVCTRGKAIQIYSDGTNIRDVSENVTDIGTVTSVNVSGGTTGLTTSGGPITTSGTITLAGTLAIANGGTGITSFGTGVQTALGQNVTGSGGIVLASSPTLSSPTMTTPNLGTPSAVTLTNATGLPLTTGVTGTLAVANGGTGVTTSTGSGNNVLSNSPTLVTPNLGTPSAATLTNATGLPLTTGVTGTLPAANGGTGLSSPGTAGYVLTSTGSGWTSSAISASGQLIRAPQIKTSGTSYTTPSNCTAIFVEMIGGGGGGGGGGNAGFNDSGGVGGGGGAYATKYLTVSPSTAYTIAIGAAGSGGPGTNQGGGSGGTTSITVGATTYSAGGGAGGGGGYSPYPGGASGGTATNADFGITGASSTGATTKTTGTNGAVASGFYSTGFGTGVSSGSGNAASFYGCGGGGGSSGGTTGGAGYQGWMRIWEYT